MTILNRKCKMVSFRLSAEEYAFAEEACRAHGIRSVALLARNATIHFMVQGKATDEYQAELRSLKAQITVLSAELARISSLVADRTANGSYRAVSAAAAEL